MESTKPQPKTVCTDNLSDDILGSGPSNNSILRICLASCPTWLYPKSFGIKDVLMVFNDAKFPAYKWKLSKIKKYPILLIWRSQYAITYLLEPEHWSASLQLGGTG